MEEDIQFLVFCKVDKPGHVLDILKIRYKTQLSDEYIRKLEFDLKSDSVIFSMCFIDDHTLTKRDLYRLIERELNDSKSTSRVISVGFPGHLMMGYNDIENKNLFLSRYDYLRLQIERNK